MVPFPESEQTLPLFSVMHQASEFSVRIFKCRGHRMTSKSRQGQRRDNHPLSPDAATKKLKKAERAAKGKYQAKKQGALRRDAADKMRRPDD
jgi:hypothetical protein